MNPNIVTGSFTSTANAKTIVCGFVPDYVKVVNFTDADVILEWWKEMGDGKGLKTANHASTQLSQVTANGISAYEGSDGAGFTIGTAIAESDKVLCWMAVRNDPGSI